MLFKHGDRADGRLTAGAVKIYTERRSAQLAGGMTKIPYFISTGEPSGDLLGAELVAALKERLPESEAHGIVGPRLRQAGVQEIYGIEELSVMGFVDVIRCFVPIKLLEDKLIVYLERLRPRFAVLVDYPGFHLHLAERLRGLGIPVFQYVAPQLWAWGEKRVERLRRVTDQVLGIMPFEESFFRERGVRFTYVGTPQVDRVSHLGDCSALFPFPSGKKVIGLFPGSRRGEVLRILPPMLAIAQILLKERPNLHLAISLAPSIEIEMLVRSLEAFKGLDTAAQNTLSTELGTYELWPRLTLVKGRSLALMKRVDAALVTSGTATLECALTETPMAVIYVAGAISYAIAKRLVKLDNISLVNLVAGKRIVEEYVQIFTAPIVAEHLVELTEGKAQESRNVLKGLHSRLKGSPGRHAAAVIAASLEEKTETGLLSP